MNTNEITFTPSTPLLGRGEIEVENKTSCFGRIFSCSDPKEGSIQEKTDSVADSILESCCDDFCLNETRGCYNPAVSCIVSSLGSTFISCIFWGPGLAMIAKGEGNVQTAGKVMVLVGFVVFSGLFVFGYILHRACSHGAAYHPDDEEPLKFSYC